MNISLSIESFPLDSHTIQDMQQLLKGFEKDYGAVLQEAFWSQPNARGFTVLAYTEEGKLAGFATSIDMVGLHQYEWSAIVQPQYRRLSIGSALADGIHHGHQQRQAEGELAAFIEEQAAEKFLEALGYKPDFEEIQLGVGTLSNHELPEGLAVSQLEGEHAELEALLASAFDEEILPVIAYNQSEENRNIWLMKKGGKLIATAALIEEEEVLWVTAFAVDPQEQGKGYGQAFLLWCRNKAYLQGKQQVLLDVETDNDAVHVYEKAGFQPISTVAYWKKG